MMDTLRRLSNGGLFLLGLSVVMGIALTVFAFFRR